MLSEARNRTLVRLIVPQLHDWSEIPGFARNDIPIRKRATLGRLLFLNGAGAPQERFRPAGDLESLAR